MSGLSLVDKCEHAVIARESQALLPAFEAIGLEHDLSLQTD
jgi:hypothetical protein